MNDHGSLAGDGVTFVLYARAWAAPQRVDPDRVAPVLPARRPRSRRRVVDWGRCHFALDARAWAALPARRPQIAWRGAHMLRQLRPGRASLCLAGTRGAHNLRRRSSGLLHARRAQPPALRAACMHTRRAQPRAGATGDGLPDVLQAHEVRATSGTPSGLYAHEARTTSGNCDRGGRHSCLAGTRGAGALRGSQRLARNGVWRLRRTRHKRHRPPVIIRG